MNILPESRRPDRIAELAESNVSQPVVSLPPPAGPSIVADSGKIRTGKGMRLLPHPTDR
ncbi:MAG TPA: hypothetical protein VFW75_09940 [Acetobacteraceae bacterium]|nr:hypothetical protein [Acetobacteraceae bacterium]